MNKRSSLWLFSAHLAFGAQAIFNFRAYAPQPVRVGSIAIMVSGPSTEPKHLSLECRKALPETSQKPPGEEAKSESTYQLSVYITIFGTVLCSVSASQYAFSLTPTVHTKTVSATASHARAPVPLPVHSPCPLESVLEEVFSSLESRVPLAP